MFKLTFFYIFPENIYFFPYFSAIFYGSQFIFPFIY